MWPFLGRENEVREIVDALDTGSIVVHGPAGIGKTRLAAAVVDALRARGVRAERIVGVGSGRQAPFQALRPILGDSPIGDVVAPIHRALGLGAHRPGPGDPVIVVDDAHLLDDASAAALVQVQAAGRVRLLITTRTDQLAASAVSPLVRSHGVATTELRTLDEEAAASLVRAALDGPVDGRTLRRIVDAAAGNALLLLELVNTAVRTGTAQLRNGMWVLHGKLPPTPILEVVVGERVSSLEGQELRALELLVVGGILRLEMLVSATSADAVESLERRGVVNAIVQADSELGGPPTTVVDVAHPLYREVLASKLGALAKLRCHRQLAELADAVGVSSADERLQLVIWQLLGGMTIEPHAALDAARHAHALNDTELAGDLAVASYRGNPSAPAAILACWCLATNGRHSDAEALAIDAQATLHDPDGRAAMVLRRAEIAWWWTHDLVGAHEILRAGVEANDASAWSDVLLAQPSVFHALRGEANDAIRLAAPFADHDVVWVRRIASIGLGFGYAINDRGEDAIAVADQAFNEALNDPDRDLSGDPAIHVVCRLFAGLYGDDAQATLQLAQSIYDIAVQQPARQARAWAAMLLGQALIARGRPLSGARYCTEAELLWVDSQLPGLARWSASSIVLAHLMVDETTAAREARTRMLTYESAGFEFNRSYEVRAEAILESTKDAHAAERSREMLVERARFESERGAKILVGDCLHELVRLGHFQSAAEVARLLEAPRGALNDARVALAAAAVQRDAVGLETVANAFESMGRDVLAAETWVLAGETHRERGRTKEATACTERAIELLRACEGARVNLLAERASNVVLTNRERQIATMAADGQTNRAIAEALVVSERTIESHLYRVFAKLGVTTRDQLRAQLDALNMS